MIDSNRLATHINVYQWREQGNREQIIGSHVIREGKGQVGINEPL